MVLLVADVGGTNTRLALIGPGAAVHDVARFENAGFASFYDVLAAYLSGRDLPPLAGCCVAVAGPVTSDRARLTNRDWSFDAAAIAAALPAPPGGPVRMVNDLVALGHALPELVPDQLAQIKPAGGLEAPNGQALVAGLGTGFNVCLVTQGCDVPAVIEAELGHASLPGSVGAALVAELGSEAADFATIEALFSGRGLSRLHQIIAGGPAQPGARILAAYDDRAVGTAAVRSVGLWARLLGLLTREMVFQYLPFGGIHFAGGAARGILGSPARAAFLGAFDAPGAFVDLIGRVPVRVITDDAAALTGAARFAARAQRPTA